VQKTYYAAYLFYPFLWPAVDRTGSELSWADYALSLIKSSYYSPVMNFVMCIATAQSKTDFFVVMG
jgi:hypothetical protein